MTRVGWVRGGRCGVWVWVSRVDGREASGRYKVLSDTADAKEETLVGMYVYLIKKQINSNFLLP